DSSVTKQRYKHRHVQLIPIRRTRKRCAERQASNPSGTGNGREKIPADHRRGGRIGVRIWPSHSYDPCSKITRCQENEFAFIPDKRRRDLRQERRCRLCRSSFREVNPARRKQEKPIWYGRALQEK